MSVDHSRRQRAVLPRSRGGDVRHFRPARLYQPDGHGGQKSVPDSFGTHPIAVIVTSPAASNAAARRLSRSGKTGTLRTL